MKFKYVFYWFILLCSVRFFDLKFFGEFLVMNFTIIGGLSLLMFLIYHQIFPNKKVEKSPQDLPLVFLYISLFTSTLGSYYFNGQPFFYSLISSRILLYYLFYLALHIIRPPTKMVLNSILVIAIAYTVIFLVQFIIYPIELVFSGMTADRAKVRIRMPGRSFAFYVSIWAFFILIIKSNLNKIKPTLLYLGTIMTVFLGVTRSIIATILGTLLIMLQKYQRKNIVLLIVPGIFAIFIFFTIINFIDPKLVSNIVTVSQNDKQQGDDVYRVLAFDHYTAELVARPLTLIFGNGNPTGGENFSSAYSIKSKEEADMGFYLDDLGYFGTLYRYGIFYLIFVIMMLYKVYKWSKKSSMYHPLAYTPYFFLALFILSFIIDFYGCNTDSIVLICLSFYLIDTFKNPSARIKDFSRKQELTA